MADNMNNDRKMKEIISDAVDRQLDKEPELTMTPEKLKKRMAARKVERIKRRARNVGVAAALIVGVGAAMVICGDFDVGANKNPKEEIITEDGVVIEDGGYGSSDGEDNVLTITDWNEVEVTKAAIKELFVPKYIPEGYDFKSLIIEDLEGDCLRSLYAFSNENNESIEIEIFTRKDGEVSFAIDAATKILSSNKGEVYLYEDRNKAIIQIDDGIVITI